jgi:hypothetical protein
MCDVCGRSLLRGERAETYINGGARRSVCELCKSRALHEGWVREGTVTAFEEISSGTERRRSLLGRLRSRRDEGGAASSSPPTLDDELDGHSWSRRAPASSPAPREGRSRAPREREPAPVSPPPGQREPRHVRAVPTSAEQKVVSSLELFNASEHRRTVAGVARSLGIPTVNVTPDDTRATMVRIVVSWELCWYLYEVDLSDDLRSVQVAGQGYELEELADAQRLPNAVADDLGQLSLQH